MKTTAIWKAVTFALVTVVFGIKAFAFTCTAAISLNPSGNFPSFPSSGGSSSVLVNVGGSGGVSCNWTISSSPWIHPSPLSGGGVNGVFQFTVTFTVDSNPDLAARSGFITATQVDGTKATDGIPQNAASGDFSLSASPSSQTVSQGLSTSYSVTVNRTGGFSGSVGLSAAGQPPGSVVNFSNSNPSTMSVSTDLDTPPGGSLITISGTNTTVVHTTQVTLNVISRVLSSFVDGSGGEHWSYLESNGHAVNISLISGSYSSTDVTLASGAAAAAVGSALSTFVDGSGGQHWSYLDVNGHAINIYSNSGSFGASDVTAASGAPAAAAGSALSTFADSSGGQHWSYLTSSGHALNIYWNSGTYLYADATAASGASAAANGSALSTFTDPSGGQHWNYLTPGGHVLNIYWSSGTYAFGDSTAAAGAPVAAAGSALSTFVDSSGGQHWSYLTSSGHALNIYWNSGTYLYADITSASGASVAAGASGLSTFTDSSGGQHWSYIAGNGHAQNIYWNSGTYGAQDVTAGSGASIAGADSITAFADPCPGTLCGEQHWGYLDVNGHAFNITFNSGAYTFVDATAASGASPSR